MGLLRFLLAVSVVVAHSAPIAGQSLVPGDTAVQAFFIISGFYIAMILNGRYEDSFRGNILFYSNRFLRIYPLYWLVLLLSIAQSAFSAYFPSLVTGLPTFSRISEFSPHINISTLTFIIATNIGILGLDIGNFLRIESGGLQFTSSFLEYSPRLYEFFFVPQAWTLSIELLVYLLAPFLFRRSRAFLITLILIIIVARSVGAQAGLSNDPFSYRFFPFELCLFLLGALNLKLYCQYGIMRNIKIGFLGLVTILLLVIFYDWLPDGPSYLPGLGSDKLIFLSFVVLFLPSIFSLTKSFAFDRYLGEMSYPIYLSHLMIVTLCNGKFGPFNLYPVVGSVIISIILVQLIDAPLSRLRERRVAAVHSE